jgi:HK97 family phage prohead protease
MSTVAAALERVTDLYCKGVLTPLAHVYMEVAALREAREQLRERAAAGSAVSFRFGIGGKARGGLEAKRLAAGSALEWKSIACRFKTDGGDTFQMYACVFGPPPDRQGDIILPGAVANTQELERDGWVALNHSMNANPIGYIVEASQDEKGLLVTARWHSTAEAQAARTVVAERTAAGKGCKASIGYVVHDADFSRQDGQPVRLLKSISVYECSLVSLPANDRATILTAAAYSTPEGGKPARFTASGRRDDWDEVIDAPGRQGAPGYAGGYRFGTG